MFVVGGGRTNKRVTRKSFSNNNFCFIVRCLTKQRRERPQMVTNADGTPLALITAVTGCPKGLGDKDLTRVGGGGGNGRFYRGADDSFTIVQRMGA